MKEKVRDVERAVVGCRLVKCFLCQGHRFCFAFDEHYGVHGVVIHNGVTAFLRLTHRDGLFHGDEGGGISELLHQTVKQLLSNPLLRSKAYPAVTPLAEDLLLVVLKTRLQNGSLRC